MPTARVFRAVGFSIFLILDAMPNDIRLLKKQLRAEARARRPSAEELPLISRTICRRMANADMLANASTVMAYVALPDEVSLRELIDQAIDSGKSVIIPYCEGDDLRLFRLHAWNELAPGAYGILEPHNDLRRKRKRQPHSADIDLVFVPGTAFDKRGGRLGRGRGYYDRFLPKLRPETLKIGVIPDRLVLPEIPMTSHDCFVDYLLTESGLAARAQGER